MRRLLDIFFLSTKRLIYLYCNNNNNNNNMVIILLETLLPRNGSKYEFDFILLLVLFPFRIISEGSPLARKRKSKKERKNCFVSAKKIYIVSHSISFTKNNKVNSFCLCFSFSFSLFFFRRFWFFLRFVFFFIIHEMSLFIRVAVKPLFNSQTCDKYVT